jgi:predicted RNase H-like HicB family nuclease
MQYTITVCHDEKEGIWFVQASDVPGLNAEAATLDALVEAIADLAPELVTANLPGAASEGRDAISLCVQHVVTASPAHAA